MTNDHTISTSRRALLGAIAVAPLAVGGVALAVAAAPSHHEWHQAVELERSTRSAYEVYHAAYVEPPSDQHEALCKSFGSRPFTPEQFAQLRAVDCRGPEERFNDLVSAHHDAFDALMRTPAPNGAGLALKLDLFAKEEAWEYGAVPEMLAAMHADAVRLSQGGA